MHFIETRHSRVANLHWFALHYSNICRRNLKQKAVFCIQSTPVGPNGSDFLSGAEYQRRKSCYILTLIPQDTLETIRQRPSTTGGSLISFMARDMIVRAESLFSDSTAAYSVQAITHALDLMANISNVLLWLHMIETVEGTALNWQIQICNEPKSRNDGLTIT